MREVQGQRGKVEVALRPTVASARDEANLVGTDPYRLLVLDPPRPQVLPPQRGAAPAAQVDVIEMAADQLQVGMPVADLRVIEDEVRVRVAADHEIRGVEAQ